MNEEGGETLAWLRYAKTAINGSHTVEDINTNFLPKECEKLLSRVNRDIKSILENHFVRAKIPAGMLVGEEEIFPENLELQLVQRLTITANRYGQVGLGRHEPWLDRNGNSLSEQCWDK